MSKFDATDHPPIHVEAYAVNEGHLEASAPVAHQTTHVEAQIQVGENNAGLKNYLTSQHWPPGLQEVFIKNALRVGERYFLIDDSGSMTSVDGHMPLSPPNSRPVSRWAELADSMTFHTTVASFLETPTQVRFLNATAASHPLVLGAGQDREGVAKATIDAIFEEGPGGLTPLCEHMNAIVADIQSKEQILRRNRQKAVVLVATDGLSSDGDLVRALKPLERLPVWLVVKLCTDEDSVVESYNALDGALEVEMDVLDDFRSEATEIHAAKNNWLNYGLPLHRLRESGMVSCKAYDKMDEVQLASAEMLDLVAGLLGGDRRDWPDPSTDFHGFFDRLQALNRAAEPVEDPLQGLAKHMWVHERRLKQAYSGEGLCTIA